MDYLFSTHRLNRCKKVQVNFPNVSKSLGETIQVQLFDVSKPARKTLKVIFLTLTSCQESFPFQFRVLDSQTQKSA